MLSIASLSAKNSVQGYQLLLKEKSGKHYSIKTNFIDNSTQLVRNIEKRSGLQCTTILSSEYRAWKRGDLDRYRQDPDKKKRVFINRLSPYIKARYLIFLPIIAFAVFLLAINIRFNWAEYQYFKIAQQPFSENFITEKESLVKSRKYSDEIDVFIKDKTQPVLHNIVVKGRFCSKKNQKFENKFNYYFFPFQQPHCFNHLLNLDSDSEPEIIFRYDSERKFRVYDFDVSTQTFIEKPISAFSGVLEQYIDTVEMRSYFSGTYWLWIYFSFLLGYLAVAGIILFGFNRAKKAYG